MHGKFLTYMYIKLTQRLQKNDHKSRIHDCLSLTKSICDAHIVECFTIIQDYSAHFYYIQIYMSFSI